MRIHKLVLSIFTVTYLVGYMLYYSIKGNYEFAFYVCVLFGLAVLIKKTEHLTKFSLSSLWGLSFVGLIHLLGGSLMVGDVVLYGWRIFPFIDLGGDFYILKMDQVIHFFGFMVASSLMYQLLIRQWVKKQNPRMILFLAMMLSMGIGSANEIVEFFAYTIIQNNGVGGLYNLGLDLTFNLVGAFIGAYVASRTKKVSSK